MKVSESVNALEELGRVRLSKSFFMRDFLYSEIAKWGKVISDAGIKPL